MVRSVPRDLLGAGGGDGIGGWPSLAGGGEVGSCHAAAPGPVGAGAGGFIGLVTEVPPEGGDAFFRRIISTRTTRTTRMRISRMSQPTVSPLPAPISMLSAEGCALMVMADIPTHAPP